MKIKRTGPNSGIINGVEIKIAKRDQLHYIRNNEITIIPIEIGIDRVVSIALKTVDEAERIGFKYQIDEVLNFLNIPHYFDF